MATVGRGTGMKKIVPYFVAMLIGVVALVAWDVHYSAAQEAVDQGYTGPNPCSLLTLADATAAMGSRVVNAPHLGTGVCQYQSPTQPGDGVTLEVINGGRDQFDAARDSTSPTVPLTGIGDAAFVFENLRLLGEKERSDNPADRSYLRWCCSPASP